MPDLFPPLFAAPAPTADRPLSGVTVLLVEDSRFASEAMRLLCLRSGARIRRADCLRTAERHLATYRPTVVMVDLGLPDGSGLDLITRLAAATPRLQAILAISGDDTLREEAMSAGADGFIQKPITNLAAFQQVVVAALNLEPALRAVDGEEVVPDRIAYRDDLASAAVILNDVMEPKEMAYAAQFLTGVAQSAGDLELAEAATTLAEDLRKDRPNGAHMARLAAIVEARLNRTDSGFAGRRSA